MLRLRKPSDRFFRTEASGFESNEAPAVPEIIHVFTVPALELARLLREAANIEHALMVQYLYAALSLKPDYESIAGGAFDSTTTMIGVAVQEMHHLARVNELLVAIGANPNIDRQDFPIRTDIYPFDLELEPLTRHSAAKYVTAEAPTDALDPAGAMTPEEKQFRLAVAKEVGVNRVNHIGSLYGAIIASLNAATAADPLLLPDAPRWITQLEQIRGQGEVDHFHFFKSVFDGSHPGFGGKDVWADPANALFPSLPLPSNPTAFEGADRTIPNEPMRKLAWLANLHYWTVMGLLHQGHSAAFNSLIGRAVSHMISCLFPIGKQLAAQAIGLPFDSLALNFGPGHTPAQGTTWLMRLLQQLQAMEVELAASLPSDYRRSSAILTLRELERLNGLQS